MLGIAPGGRLAVLVEFAEARGRVEVNRRGHALGLIEEAALGHVGAVGKGGEQRRLLILGAADKRVVVVFNGRRVEKGQAGEEIFSFLLAAVAQEKVDVTVGVDRLGAGSVGFRDDQVGKGDNCLILMGIEDFGLPGIGGGFCGLSRRRGGRLRGSQCVLRERGRSGECACFKKVPAIHIFPMLTQSTPASLAFDYGKLHARHKAWNRTRRSTGEEEVA